jgi:hypothetical protein
MRKPSHEAWASFMLAIMLGIAMLGLGYLALPRFDGQIR